jgi:hypothetical protein
MSYAERRRFRLILFLAGIVFLAMSAMLANATTLVHMPFEDLAQESTAVARLKCLGAESRWDGREIWTETRFEAGDVSNRAEYGDRDGERDAGFGDGVSI